MEFAGETITTIPMMTLVVAAFAVGFGWTAGAWLFNNLPGLIVLAILYPLSWLMNRMEKRR